MTWQPIETAPKNNVILLNVGLPWAVAGIWNAQNQSWCYANLQASGDIAEFSDTYFENEHDKNPTHWMPMPPLPRKIKFGTLKK